MATILKDKKKQKKRVSKQSSPKKQTAKGFEQAWEFWKGIQVDLTNFKFDREEANAR
jgi:hypothetical protein